MATWSRRSKQLIAPSDGAAAVAREGEKEDEMTATTTDLTLEEIQEFWRLLALAYRATVDVNHHRSAGLSVRDLLTTLAEASSNDVPEALIAECEASGELWEVAWWSSSCGHFDFAAGSWTALVRRVLAARSELESDAAYFGRCAVTRLRASGPECPRCRRVAGPAHGRVPAAAMFPTARYCVPCGVVYGEEVEP